jgi:AraC-like DNA-binding protein
LPEPIDSYREMSAIIERSTEGDGEFDTAVGGLYFNRRTSVSQPLHTAQWPCFALVTQGAKSLMLGGQIFHYGVGDCLIVSFDLPVVSRVTEASAEAPHLGLGLAIDPSRLGEVLGRAELPTKTPSHSAPGVTVGRASPELLDSTVRLLRLLEEPGDIAVVAPLIEQEVLYRLLKSPHGAMLLRIAALDSPHNRVAKAMSWLRQNYSRRLRINELACHAGMSVSSLHHHFRAIAAMTPLEYQKRLRLHEARRLILLEGLDIGSTGYRVGYRSPSQFSREYRRLYGLSPLQDVQSRVVAD